MDYRKELKIRGDALGIDWNALAKAHRLAPETLSAMLEGEIPPLRSVMRAVLVKTMPAFGPGFREEDVALRKTILEQINTLPDLSAQDRPVPKKKPKPQRRSLFAAPFLPLNDRPFALVLSDVLMDLGMEYDGIVAYAKEQGITPDDTRSRGSHNYLPVDTVLDALMEKGLKAQDVQKLHDAYDRAVLQEHRQDRSR